MSDKHLRLTLYEAFDLLWSAHLEGKPSGASFLANRKALVRSFGGKFLDEITPFDFRNHREDRLNGRKGHRQVRLGSVFHDHGLLHLLFSKLTEWKREGMRPNGLDLSRLMLPPHFPTVGSKKRRGPKRKVVATPEEFLRLCMASTDRLKRTLEALVDLDIRQGDLKRLRPSNYNPYTDQVEWIQAKTGKENAIPATERVRKHFSEARENGWEFVYDLTNVIKEFKDARHEAKVWHLTRRDLRKTAYNAALRETKDYRVAAMLAGHTTTRTGMDFYEVEFREDLKPVVAFLEKAYRSS